MNRTNARVLARQPAAMNSKLKWPNHTSGLSLVQLDWKTARAHACLISDTVLIHVRPAEIEPMDLEIVELLKLLTTN